jgi:3-oxoacyl-[acyl-carrier-protein] synthase-1
MTSCIRHVAVSCGLGENLAQAVSALLAARVSPCEERFDDLADPVAVPYFAIPREERAATDLYDKLLQMAEDMLQDLSASERRRTGLFLGSSSFDVNVSEFLFHQQLRQGERPVPMPIVGYGKLAQRLGEKFSLSPQRHTYITACTSSANALLYAHRMLAAGLVDHALVIGLEFFNATTLLGFHGLGLISPRGALSPFSRVRDGLVLGEGIGALLLSRDGATGIHLCGGAIRTDNHSLTAANADGSSIAAVIRDGLANSGITADDIVALKVHGTASLMNDEAEAAGLKHLFPHGRIPPVLAFKSFCGHTLGACGAVETALLVGCLQRGMLPGNPYSEMDPALGISLLRQSVPAPAGHYLLNCFAFGGNNNVLVLRRDPS